jgi:hypothetical protein
MVHLLQSRTDEAIVWRSASPAIPSNHLHLPMPFEARPNAPPPNAPKPAGYGVKVLFQASRG